MEANLLPLKESLKDYYIIPYRDFCKKRLKISVSYAYSLLPIVQCFYAIAHRPTRDVDIVGISVVIRENIMFLQTKNPEKSVKKITSCTKVSALSHFRVFIVIFLV
jgi:hypothetical protein